MAGKAVALLKRAWADPVWSKVIAQVINWTLVAIGGLAVALLIWFRNNLADLPAFCRNAAVTLWGWLWNYVPIPWFFILFVAFMFTILGWCLVRSRRKRSDLESDWFRSVVCRPSDNACYIISRKSLLCLTAEALGATTQKRVGATGHQRWRLHEKNGSWRIGCVEHSGFFLAPESETSEGLVLRHESEIAPAEWTVEPAEDGSVVFVSTDQQACLDVKGGLPSEGLVIRHRNIHRQENQRWVLVPFERAD